MPQIYQTPNMELAIRRMMERNDRCVVFRQHWCVNHIPPRLNEVWDIPSIVARSWDNFAQDNIRKWAESGDLLFYQGGMFDPDMLPECDALLYIEAPLLHSVFEQYQDRVRREIIVYRPPSWLLHERSVYFKWPSGDYYRTLEMVMKALIGRPLTPRLEAAVKYAGFPLEKTAAFEAKEIEGIMGIPERQLRYLLKWSGFRGSYRRFHCYTPQYFPFGRDKDLKEMYGVLEQEPDVYRGTRMLRFDELKRVYEEGLQARVPGFKHLLKVLVKEGCVAKDPNIYVVKEGWRPASYFIVDAINNAKKGEWYKMQNLIDSAPVYPL